MLSTLHILAITVAVGIASLYTIVITRYCLLARLWLPKHARWQRKHHGCCPECGYDLRGSPGGTCPECGCEVHRHDVPQHGPSSPLLIDKQPRWVSAIVILIMAVTFIVLKLWL